MDRFPNELSGEQRQRIATARAMILKPRFVLLNEPTSAFDHSIQAQVIDLLWNPRRKHGLGYLFASHDLKVIRALCHNVIVMQHGRVVERGSTQDVLEDLQTDYTKRRVHAALDLSPAA